MARNWIVEGDTTVSGGRVVSGSPTEDIDGKPWAFVGCPVDCAQHGPTTIVTGDETMIICGQPAARHGDYCACGCMLVSTQQTRAFVDQGSAAPSTAKAPAATGQAAQPASSNGTVPQLPPVGGQSTANPPVCWLKDHDVAVSCDADGRYSETFDKNGVKHGYHTPRKFKVAVPIKTGGNLTVEVKFKAIALSGVIAADVTAAKTSLESGVATYWNNSFFLEITDQPCGIKTLPIEYKIVWVTSGADYTMKVHASYPREGVTGTVLDVSKSTTSWTYAHEFGHCVGDPDEYSYTHDTETVQYYKPDGTLDPNAIVSPPLKLGSDPSATIMSTFGNTTVLPRHAWSIGREAQELLTKEIGRPVTCNVI